MLSSVAAFTLQWGVSNCDTVWLTKPKIFTSGPLQEKCANSRYEIMDEKHFRAMPGTGYLVNFVINIYKIFFS